MIEIKNLVKIYRVNPIVNDLSVTINDGDIISVIGPSGCGKSTFIKCINMLERPTSGQIFIDGEEITAVGYDLLKVSRKVGMVFQNFNLSEHMTVIENVMVPQIEILKTGKQEAYDKAVALLKRVNLFQKAFSYPNQLSGGQKQRVAIARTLAMDPEIILFDEPVSALDPAMVGEVKAVIKDLTNTGKTMIIVTHDMDFARTIGNRLFYMDEGVIYEEGDPETIFSNPKKEKTRRFVNGLKVLEFRIDSSDYDFYGAYASIDEYCRKNQIDYKKSYHIHSVFEELCQGILLKKLDDYKVHFTIVYSNKDERVEITVLYGDEPFNIIDKKTDDLPLKIVRGISSSLKYEQTDENGYANKIFVEID